MELLMIYEISPNPSLPKRGKEGEDLAEGLERKCRNVSLDYAKQTTQQERRKRK
jgi:hypothetical protein